MLANTGKYNVADIRSALQSVMMDDVGVFRTEQGIQSALDRVRALQAEMTEVTVMDKGQRFNTELLEAIELENLLDLAEVTAASALARTESRGVHSREDYQERDDVNWLKHSYVFKKEGQITLDYDPVVITDYVPKERTY